MASRAPATAQASEVESDPEASISATASNLGGNPIRTGSGIVAPAPGSTAGAVRERNAKMPTSVPPRVVVLRE